MTTTDKTTTGQPPGPELSEPETPLEWALYYAARGNRVLPLYEMIRSADGLRCACSKGADCDQKPGKHPRTTHGLYDATTDQHQIRRWWTQWPGANVGIRTGDRDLVLDVDVDKGGDESLEALESKHGKLPVTRQALTGSGGRHHWFRLPEGVQLSCTTDFEYGLDTRADNGYVVCAPSNHLSGNTYCWDGIAGFNEPVADIPQWLLDKLLSRRDKTGAGPWGKIDIVVNRHPELPQTLVDLIEKDPALSSLWNLRRPDFVNPKRGDPNFSKYDAGLASHFAKAGLPHQQIADILTAFRLKHGNPKGKGYRLDYLKRTIHFAVYGDDGIAAAPPMEIVPYEAPAAADPEVQPQGATPEMEPMVREALWHLTEFEDSCVRNGRRGTQEDYDREWEYKSKLTPVAELMYFILHGPELLSGCGCCDSSGKVAEGSRHIAEAIAWMRDNRTPDEALWHLRALLEEAKFSGKPGRLIDAALPLATISEAEFADFCTVAKQAERESKTGLRINLQTLKKVRSDEIRRLSKSGRGALACGETPCIVINNRQLCDMRNECVAALRLRNEPPRIFHRESDLVRLIIEPSGKPRLDPLTSVSLSGILADVARFFVVGDGGPPTNVVPRRDLAEDILTYDFEDPPFPHLEGLVSTPVVRTDGSILRDPGYDPTSKLIYHPPAGFELPPVPEEPTKEQIAQAKERLEYLVADFRFEGESDRTNFFAYCLTPLMRPQLTVAPLCVIDSPERGSGKGLLTNLAAIIHTGEEVAATTAPATREEWRKVLFALLYEGRTFLVLDNLKGIVESDVLEAVITAPSIQDRVLGATRMCTVLNRATWAATANNIKLSTDMGRRCYRVRIDPKMARAYLRDDFKEPDLVGYCIANRGELLAALLTLVRGWYAADKPGPGGKPLGTFNRWRMMVGGILKNAGFDGFLANQRKLYIEADQESEDWEVFLRQVQPYLDHDGFTAKSVVALITTEQKDEISLPRELADIFKQPTTHEASRPNPSFTTLVGYALKSHRDTRHGDSGIYLKRIENDRTGVARFVIREGDE
jgi:Bifunctional DNA primase/polymerase, N-terminal